MVKFVGKQSIPVVLKLFLLADPFCFFKITADPNNFQNIDIVKKTIQNTYSSTTFTVS